MARNESPHVKALEKSAYAALVAGRYAEAHADCRRVLTAEPGNRAAIFVLGMLAYREHRYEEAVAMLERAVRINRHNIEARATLALALLALGRHDEAVAETRRALALRPDLAALHCNLGLMQKDQCRLTEALASFDRAIAIDPQYSEAYTGRALARLLQGDTRSAWRDHEWRVPYRQGAPGYIVDPRNPGKRAPHPSSLLPIDLSGRRVLALGEQGLGDELFFLRYAPLVKAKGAWLGYMGNPKLASLLARAEPIDEIATGNRLPDAIDILLAVGDLPLLAAAERAPPPLRLEPHAAAIAAARARLAASGQAPYLGVTWRAGRTSLAGQRRAFSKELPVKALAGAVAGWPGTIVVLQRGPQPGEIEQFRQAVAAPSADLSAANENLEEMLALLASIEEYAGVSNTNMHLRAGAGQVARVLIPWPPEWRWTAAGEASPWFPGFSLYREDAKRGWEQALERLRGDLLLAAAGGAGEAARSAPA